ncbi:MAG: hypothetical protein ACLTJG_18925 [[Clostridium] innocuum]
MKKEQVRLETLHIPEIPEDDILEVITQVKLLLHKQPVKKHEDSLLRILRELLYVHGWKSIAVQAALILLVALGVWLCLPSGYQVNSVAFLSLGSSLLSVAITVEVFRCDIYGMKELEMASPYSPQRMLMWKMLLLGGISFVGILIIALSISMHTDIHLLTLLYSGCIPFLLLNAFPASYHDQVYSVLTYTAYGRRSCIAGDVGAGIGSACWTIWRQLCLLLCASGYVFGIRRNFHA